MAQAGPAPPQASVGEPQSALEQALRKQATDGESASPEALGASKRLIADVAHRPPLDPALRATTAEYLADVRESADGQEGMLAFIEKRKPNWNV